MASGCCELGLRWRNAEKAEVGAPGMGYDPSPDRYVRSFLLSGPVDESVNSEYPEFGVKRQREGRDPSAVRDRTLRSDVSARTQNSRIEIPCRARDQKETRGGRPQKVAAKRRLLG